MTTARKKQKEKGPHVAAVFEHKTHKVRLSRKPEAQEKVAELIAKAVKKCGNLTPTYFQQIESDSYGVWAEFNRNDIFDAQT